jgi:hypothetical protein
LLGRATRLFLIIDLERTSDARRVVELHHQLKRARPSDLTAIMPLWRRLPKTKLGRLTRLRLAYF